VCFTRLLLLLLLLLVLFLFYFIFVLFLIWVVVSLSTVCLKRGPFDYFYRHKQHRYHLHFTVVGAGWTGYWERGSLFFVCVEKEKKKKPYIGL
jgi:hypothetical protein